MCDEPSAISDSTGSHTRVGNDFAQTAGWVRDLGIYLDSEASMKIHVSRTVSSCFSVLRQLRSIHRSVTCPVLQWLVVSLVLSRLDTGNATLGGLPGRELNRLQSVAECCCTTYLRGEQVRSRNTASICDLHWLRCQSVSILRSLCSSTGVFMV